MTQMADFFNLRIIAYIVFIFMFKATASTKTCRSLNPHENITCCVPECLSSSSNESCDHPCPTGMSLLSTQTYSNSCENFTENANLIYSVKTICILHCPPQYIEITVKTKSLCIECEYLCANPYLHGYINDVCFCKDLLNMTSLEYNTTLVTFNTTCKQEYTTAGSGSSLNNYVLSVGSGVVFIIIIVATICVCRWRSKFLRQAEKCQKVQERNTAPHEESIFYVNMPNENYSARAKSNHYADMPNDNSVSKDIPQIPKTTLRDPKKVEESQNYIEMLNDNRVSQKSESTSTTIGVVNQVVNPNRCDDNYLKGIESTNILIERVRTDTRKEDDGNVNNANSNIKREHERGRFNIDETENGEGTNYLSMHLGPTPQTKNINIIDDINDKVSLCIVKYESNCLKPKEKFEKKPQLSDFIPGVYETMNTLKTSEDGVPDIPTNTVFTAILSKTTHPVTKAPLSTSSNNDKTVDTVTKSSKFVSDRTIDSNSKPTDVIPNNIYETIETVLEPSDFVDKPTGAISKGPEFNPNIFQIMYVPDENVDELPKSLEGVLDTNAKPTDVIPNIYETIDSITELSTEDSHTIAKAVSIPRDLNHKGYETMDTVKQLDGCIGGGIKSSRRVKNGRLLSTKKPKNVKNSKSKNTSIRDRDRACNEGNNSNETLSAQPPASKEFLLNSDLTEKGASWTVNGDSQNDATGNINSWTLIKNNEELYDEIHDNYANNTEKTVSDLNGTNSVTEKKENRTSEESNAAKLINSRLKNCSSFHEKLKQKRIQLETN